MPRDKNNHILIGEVVSDKDSSIIYNIGVDKRISEQYKHAHFTCNCPAFKFSGKGGKERHCKHTEFFTPNFEEYFRDDVKAKFGGDPKIALQKILGWELDFSTDIFTFKNQVIATSFLQVILDLTEIVCPRIMCSHVMRGQFNSSEIQVCEKCKKGFMP